MPKSYVQRCHIRNYGPIRDVELQLSPLHALIGPNDSGKSSLLRSLQTTFDISQLARVGAPESLRGQVTAGFRVETSDGVSFSSEPDVDGARLDKLEFAKQVVQRSHREGHGFQFGIPPTRPWPSGEHSASLLGRLSGCTFLRLDPDCLRAPTKLIADDQKIAFFDERGTGLGAVYDAIFAREPDRFFEFERRVTALFPSVSKLRIQNRADGSKSIGARLNDGELVSTRDLSEGLLYFLAFLSMEFIGAGTRLLLVEEPENGLHPSRIAEVMKVLRVVSETACQVVLATHSPLVVNELRPDEVSIVTRNNRSGTIVTPITESVNFKERAKVYALGELWLSYANGTDEGPLLNNGDEGHSP